VSMEPGLERPWSRGWPYPVRYEAETEVSSDVVVLGGGLAGCFAAIAAARKGASVTLVDKAATRRSGCVGAGLDHWQEIHIPGVTRVSAEQLTKARGQNHDGYFREEMNLVMAREAWDRLLDLERMGIKIRDTEGEYRGAIQRDDETGLLFAHDATARHSVIFWGAGEFGKQRQGIKPALHRECKRLGVKIYDRVMATGLLNEGGRPGAPVIGATGVNVRTGEFYVFRAKATILTTGWVSRLWFYAGNEWRAGWGHQGFGAATNTGDGMAMAFRAGAELINMEASQPGAPGYGSGVGPLPGVSGLSDKRGDSHWPATVVDSKGRQIPTAMPPYRPQNYRLSIGNQLCYLGPGGLDKYDGEALRKLIHQGRVSPPLYLDSPTMAEVDRRVVFEVNDRNEAGWANSIKALATRGHGHDPAADRVEVQDPIIQRYGREMKWGGSGGGVYIDTDARTTLPRLYAAGDMTPGCVNAPGAAVFGWRAGWSATADALSNDPPVEGVIPMTGEERRQVEDEKERIYACLRPQDGISWRELNLAVKYVMTTYCNEVKNEEMLREGLAAFGELREQEVPRLSAATPHELLHAVEVLNLIDIGEAIIQSSLARKASSRALGFYRPDHPELDPPEWRRWVSVSKENGEIKIGSRPIGLIGEEV
jgi:succinate dehydrogenase/fumarate reductase flavoprotein subunit